MFSFLFGSRKKPSRKSSSKARGLARQRLPLSLEQLEYRVVPSGVGPGGGGGGGGGGGPPTISWTWLGSAGDGKWDTPANWSATAGALNAYPGKTRAGTGENQENDLVTINTGATAATITVQSADTLSIQSLTTTANDTLAIAGGSLTVAATVAANSTLNGPLTLTGGSLTAASAAAGSAVTVTVNGATTATAASLLTLGGATLSLPSLTTYDNTSMNGTTLQALGAGSVVNLPALANLGTLDATLNISVQQGGVMNLPELTLSGSTPNIAFDAEGSGSQINMPSPTALDGDTVFLAAGGTLPLGQLARFTNGSLDIVGESVTLSVLTDADGSNLDADGGATLSLPGLTGYANANASNPTTFSAYGAGSLLDVSALKTIGTLGSSWSVLARQGGEVNVSGLTSFTNPNSQFTLSFGGTIDFPGAAVTMPTSTDAPTIVVPALPQGVTLNLQDTATGAIFNIAAGDAVDVTNGIFTGGATFNVGAGATIDLTGGSGFYQRQPVTYSGTLTGSGAGTVQFSGGRLTIGLGGLTLDFPSNLFQWTGGILDGAMGDAINLGTLNLSGDSNKVFADYGTLDNYGTIVQSGGGYLGLASEGAAYTTLKNEAGASYLIESDSGILLYDEGITQVENAGTIRKTAGDGISNLLVAGPITNTGTIEADSGTLWLDAYSVSPVSNGILTGGTWNALNGSTLVLPDIRTNGVFSNTAITTNQANITLSGVGATVVGFAGLNANAGSLTVTDGATFTTAGDFSNSGSLTVGAGSTLTVSGNYTQTTAGTLNTQLDGTPASGQFGQLAVTGSAALAGNFGVALVPGFGPTAGQDFQPLTYASLSSTFAQLTGLNPFFTAAFNPTALDLIDSSTNAVDLVASSVTAPTTATAGQPITVNWQVSNPGSQAASGSWQDSVYLSTTPAITSSSILLGTATHTGGLTAGGSYTGAWTGATPALLPGFYYLLVQVDSLYSVADPNRSNNTLAATTGLLDVMLPALTLGTPFNDTFTAADQDHYYQVTVPAGGTLVVSLASAASGGGVALYIGQGILPTPSNYQEAATTASQPSPTVSVPQVLTAGTYYILAHSIAGSAATAAYTLTATQATGLTVSAPATPYTGGNGGNVTVEIDGTNFTPTSTAWLTLLGGTPILASAIDFVSASQLYATFNLTGTPIGSYTLKVEQGMMSATAPAPFQVVAANPAGLSLAISAPQYVRLGRTGTIVITYINGSNNDLVAPMLEIQSTNSLVYFSTPDDPNNYTQDTQILAVAASGPAGILRPGQSGQLTLTLLLTDTTVGVEIPVQVSQIIPGQTIDWASQQAALQPAGTPTAAWNVIFGNFEAIVGTTTDTYNAALAQAATYLGGLGQTTTQVSDVGPLWSFLISQADADFPTPLLSSAVDAALSTPGSLSLAINRAFMSSISGRSTPGIFGLGWTTPWQTSLSVDAFGNVSVNTGPTTTYFPIQANGTYLDTPGEYGSLTRSGSIYTYTDSAGTQFVFLPASGLSTSSLLNYEQDTNGNRITLGYNGQNQLVTLTYSNPSDPSEQTEQLTLAYNAQGFVSQEADGTGDVWSYAYDAAGHLLSVTAPGPTAAGLTTSYSYADGSNPEIANALLSITSPDGSQQNFSYDALGRLSGTSANGGTQATTYTYLGEAEIKATDSAGDVSFVWFNDLGLTARVQDPLGGISTYQYDINGDPISYTNAAGATYQYAYDQNGNVTQTVNPLGQTAQMTYNGLSELTSLTDAGNNTTQYRYSSAGNLLSITYPDQTSRSFTYDPLGNLTDTILQNGDAIGSQSNAQGLIIQESFADGTSQTMTYDAHGNLLTANTYDASGNPTGTTTLTYNAANELTSITYPPSTGYPKGQYLTFTYNTQGQRTQSVDQNGYTVQYSYDALGRLSELTDGSNNRIVQYTYNNLGQLQEKLNGNGTYTTYAYDAAGDLTQEVNYAGGTTVNSSFTYTYNVLGEQTSMTDASGNVTTYGYDATGQLTSVALPGGATIQYVYNAAGDRTEVLNSGVPTSYASNADNEITQVGSTIYTYDQNGNLRTVTDASGTTTYTYNDLNQLVSIGAPDGTVTAFQYSPLGFLVGTTVTDGGVSNQTNYLVDPSDLGNVVSAYNGDGSLIADYTYGLGLVSQTGPSGTGYYDFDASGNAVGITGANGSYVNQYSYLPFGETTTNSAKLPNPFTFAGQVGVMQIGISLFSMRARDYDPTTAQFTTNDPIGLLGGDTDVRRYVHNDPVNQVDPTGNGDSPIPDFRIRLDQGPQVLAEDLEAEVNLLKQAITDAVAKDGAVDESLVRLFQEARDNLAFVQQKIAAGGAGGTGVATSAAAAGIRAAAGTAAAGAPAWVAPVIDVLPWVVVGVGGFFASFYIYSWFFHQAGFDTLYEQIPDSFFGADNNNHGVARTHTQAITSHDPNALIGPGGFGAANFLTPTGTWPYTIDFENDGSTAAQTVTVTEQLDSNLDWTTFQLGSFGWGSVNVTVPTGLTQYQTTVSYANSDGTPLKVLVTLDFNVQTGLLTATFTSLDPLTGETPAGVFDGFLYPENGSGDGEGYVQYSVQPKANLATGTVIDQLASVVFDTNAPLATDPSLVTIDNGPPTSSVSRLPLGEFSDSFMVNWAGQDDANGSGIAYYNVYVADDGGAFTLWQDDTAQTSATYTGVEGHTYGFYSVATDNVGHVETTPTTAQATTTVDDTPPISSVSTLPSFSPGSFTVQWSGSDTNGFTIAGYNVYVADNGGVFTLWQADTAQTSATYSGVNGHTYGFYSVAIDNLGNTQPTPTSAQAKTTVDTAPPASCVSALPAVSPLTFTVRWSGSDGTGSGVATYLIYVAADGGAFTPWLTNTTQTSASYTGQNGHTYGFYSVATDNVGNVQPTPAAAQASTTIDATPTVTVSGGPFTYDGNHHAATVTVTGSITGDPNPSGTTVVTYVLGSYNSTTPPTHAGTYAVTVAFTTTDPNYLNGSGSGTITINPAILNYTIANDSQTYGKPANLGADLGTTIAGVNGEKLTITYASKGDTAAATVGTYAISGSVSDDTGLASDYQVTLTPGTLTVNPALSLVSVQTVKALQNISTGSILLATFTVQTGQTLTASNFTASINWDGSSADTTHDSVSINGTTVQLYGVHTYTSGGHYSPVVTLIYNGSNSISTNPTNPTVNVGTNVTSSASLTHNAPLHVIAGQYSGLYLSTLTVKNTSGSAINGSLEIVLSGLAGGSASLSYATVTVAGTTYNLPITLDAAGDPVIFLSKSILSSLASGASLSVSLYFSESKAVTPAYTPLLFSDPFDS